MLWQRFRENLNDAPAVQATFSSVFLSQNELLVTPFPFIQVASWVWPDIGFQVPTTLGANILAFWSDRYLTFFAHGQLALRRDSRRQRLFFLFIEQINSSLKGV